ncbi:MAG TPA: hypothetical protein VES01_07870 [Dermatophilaceae bacterium]|nr:hypothetical protein [Dermatophilaceae bacterium]
MRCGFSYTINNDWGQIAIVLGLIVLGLAQGCIVALVFNTLLSSSPPSLAGDVGASRGLTHNLSGSAGISVATAMAVGLLGGLVTSQAIASPVITPTVISQVTIDNVTFITNEQLKEVLAKTTAASAEVDKTVLIYEDARLRALKITMLILAALALLAVIPAGRIPGFRHEDLPVGYPKDEDAIYDLGENGESAPA